MNISHLLTIVGIFVAVFVGVASLVCMFLFFFELCQKVGEIHHSMGLDKSESKEPEDLETH